MDQPADRLDLAKAAEMHREVELLYEERDLSGISVVEDEIRWLKETGNQLRVRAMGSVERGMDDHNQNDIWCGLQVFYNLGELRSSVDQLVGKYKMLGVKSAVDMKAISATQIGGGKKAGEALWEKMGRCLDDLHKVVTAVWQLQSVLAKKRVPFTQVLFLHEVWKVSLICLL